MTPQEAYEHFCKTGEDTFTLTKGKKSLRIIFVTDAGDIYAPSRRKHYLIQQFYDGWEALNDAASPSSNSAPRQAD